MTELDVIKKSKLPNTIRSLKQDLQRIGVRKGMVLLVHSSLSSVGWVCGGSQSLIIALEESVGKEGTIVMPAHSGDMSDPGSWSNPPVPKEWHDTIRENMPVFKKELTPTRGIGIVPEVFRKQKGAFRSNHPQDSFAATGRHAEKITMDHQLEFGLGQGSPLQKIYELGGYVLLIGVGHDSNTSLHLAEYLAEYKGKKYIKTGASMKVDGKRKWVIFRDIEVNTDDFKMLGDEFNKKHADSIMTGNIGMANSYLFSQKLLVDFAVKWFEENRK